MSPWSPQMGIFFIYINLNYNIQRNNELITYATSCIFADIQGKVMNPATFLSGNIDAY